MCHLAQGLFDPASNTFAKAQATTMSTPPVSVNNECSSA